MAPGEYVITEPITFRGKAITVRSEAGRDQTIILMGTPADTNRGSVVVFENNETDASVLDGFTITGGTGCRLWRAESDWVPEFNWDGGGILFNASSGTVQNCAIVQNRVVDAGGGVMVISGSSAILTNCIISENSAPNPDESGGGVSCCYDSSVTMTYCIIRDNSTRAVGAGVTSWDNSSVNLIHCAIMFNTAQKCGSGVYVGHASATLTNCVIALNMGASWGGGGVMCSYPDASLTITNCTIWGNSAGSLYWGGGGVLCRQASATVTNSIICGNTSPRGREISVQDPASTLTIAYSDVAGGQAGVYVEGSCTLNWGAGNIDAEPGYWAYINDPNIIVGPDDPNAVWIDGDYHLKSEAGRWDPYSESWVLDDVTSPCIDRGDPNSPVGDEPDPNGGIINMGAYGGTPEASMSIGQLPPLPLPIPQAHWKLDETEGTIAYDSAGDNDGIVNGGPLWQPTDGQIDGALAFDGIDDYVLTPFVLNPAKSPSSIFVWVKGGAPGQAVLSQAGGANWILADASEGKLMTELKASGRGATELLSQTIITDGNWHRIGLAWDGSNRTLYVDNVAVAEDTQHNLAGSNNGLYIGTGTAMEPGSFWSGLIDDVRIYNRAVRP